MCRGIERITSIEAETGDLSLSVKARTETLALVLFASATCGAQAFECAPLKPSTSRVPAYRPVPDQARCEGFFDRRVSQPFIELVSLTRGPWPAAGDATLSALEIHADTRSQIRLVVQPQRSGPFYRVDAALLGQQVLLWDPTPMLGATGLRLSDLGFLALTGSTPLPGAVPVALTASGRQARRADAVVRVSVPVTSVAWRSYRLGAEAAWTEVPNSQLFAWQRITLPIDLPPDGRELRVDVQAVAASDGRALPMLRLAIVGPNVGTP